MSAGILLAIELAALLTGLLLIEAFVLPETSTPPSVIWLSVLTAFVAALAAHGMYCLQERRRRRRHAHTVRAGLLVVLAALAAQRISGSMPLGAVLVMSACALPLSLALRIVYQQALDRFSGADSHASRVLYISPAESSRSAVASAIEAVASRTRGVRPLGVIRSAAPLPPRRENHGLRELGLLDELESIMQKERPDEVVVLDDHLDHTHLEQLIAICRRRRLRLRLPDTAALCKGTSAAIAQVGEGPLFISRIERSQGPAWFMKRSLDVSMALVLLALTAPVFAAVALTIKLTSPGPVFFADRRVGLGQEVFSCFKFRTMRADAQTLQTNLEALNEGDGAVFKLRHDPRITPVGRVLRRLSIDELPQLLNVLRGDMSVVGPRPLPLRDNRLLDGAARGRHVVLPGITGLWQVSGRSDTSFDRMMRLDFEYIDSWSLWLDLSIVARTLKVVVASRGAY